MNVIENQPVIAENNVVQLGPFAQSKVSIEEDDSHLPYDVVDDLLNEFADAEDEFDDDFDAEIEALQLGSSKPGGAEAILDRLDLDSKEYDQIRNIQGRLISLQETRRKMSFLMGEIGHARGVGF